MAGSLLRAYPQTDLSAVKDELKNFLSLLAKDTEDVGCSTLFHVVPRRVLWWRLPRDPHRQDLAVHRHVPPTMAMITAQKDPKARLKSKLTKTEGILQLAVSQQSLLFNRFSCHQPDSLVPARKHQTLSNTFKHCFVMFCGFRNRMI